MRPIDYLKALGVAAGVLAANLLITTAAITVYSLAIEPGRPQSYYADMAPEIGAWSGPAGGMALMFAVGWVFARRRPERNGLAFVGTVFGLYLLLDVALGLAAAPPSALFTLQFAVSLALAGAAGLAGAVLGGRGTAA